MAGGWGDPELAERSKIYYIAGAWDPTVQPTLAPRGSMYMRVGALGGAVYQKQDDGNTTNWTLNNTSGGGGGGIPVTHNIYVEENGDDTTGDGSISAPVKTINKAITLCSNPLLVYAIVPGTGVYNGADVTWLPNVNLFGNGSPEINNNINYTSPAGSNSYFTFQNVKMGGLITLDLGPAAIAIHTFTTGSYNIDRIDTAPVGPWVILISDATLGASSFGGSCILSNILFVSSMDIKAGGRVLAGNCPLGIPITMDGTASISLQSCNTQGANFIGTISGGNTPLIVTDTDSFDGAVYSNCNVSYANVNGTLINGFATDAGVLSATQPGSRVNGVAIDAGSQILSNGYGSEASGRAIAGAGIFSTQIATVARGFADGSSAYIEAQDDASSAVGIVSNTGFVSVAGKVSCAFGKADAGSIVVGSVAGTIASVAFGYLSGVDPSASIIANGKASVSFGSNNGITSAINALGEGVVCFGHHGPVSTGIIACGGFGSLVFGRVTSSGAIRNPTNSSGSLVHGFTESTNALGAIEITIIRPGDSHHGSKASGYIQGSNTPGTIRVRNGTLTGGVSNQGGSEARGFVSTGATGNITAERSGSTAIGRISGTGSTISALGHGSFARGVASNGGTITATSFGDAGMAYGVSSGNGGLITSQGRGATAFGNNTSSGSIDAGSQASLAFGTNDGGIGLGTSSKIDATGSGCLAFGYNGSSGTVANPVVGIIAQGAGALTFGVTNGDSSIFNEGLGNLTFGTTTTDGLIKNSGSGNYIGGVSDSLTNKLESFASGSFIHGRNIQIGGSGSYAAAFGEGHQVDAFYQFACGSYSVITANTAFVVGNGVVGTPSNAFEVRKDGSYKTEGYQNQKTRIVSAFDYTVNSISPDDLIVAITSAPLQKVIMPLAPLEGDTYKIKLDVVSTDPLEIDGNGNNIEAASTFTISAGNAITLSFANAKWQIMSFV